MNEQLDLFDQEAQFPVLIPGVVRYSTSHIDGRAVFWASRCDYLRDGRGLRSGPAECAGPFANLAEALLAFGPETSWAKINKAIRERGLAVSTE